MNATTSNVKIFAAKLSALPDWFRASPRIALAFTVAAVATLAVAMLLWAREPAYRVVYSNISDEDGGAIVAELGKMNVPYRFEQHGGAVMVPQDQMHEVRLKLAQLGLPKGGAVGFELLDEEKFGISQFSEQINFQRALEGELSRTIEALGSVNAARVHLAIPKPSMFVREQNSPSAAVTVNLSQGRTLDAGQINAISYLIASAVPGLNPDKVTIVDQRGQLMSQGGEQMQQTAERRYINDIEADYQRRIQAILAPLLGSGNVRAQVTAQLDFTAYEQTNEQYQPNSTPEKMAIRSRQSSSAEQGGKNPASGVPGALSNQPPLPVNGPIDKPKDSGKKDDSGATVLNPVPYNQRQDDTTNYELDRKLTHTRHNSVRIERLSAAVVVNWLPAKEGENAPLSEKQMQQITALVKEAMGFSDSRGDSVNIVNSPFTQADDGMMLPWWQQPWLITLAISAARWLGVALVLWLLWRKVVLPVWRRQQAQLALLREQAEQARQQEQVRVQQQAERNLEIKAAQRAESEITSQQLRELAAEDPRIIALVVRQWINEENKAS